MKYYKLHLIAAILMLMISCKKNADTLQSTVEAKTLLNVSYGASPEQKMDIYLPANRNMSFTKVLIMIHGGGWSGGDKTDMTQFADTMQRRLPDYAVFNINYRLAVGTNLFPAQESDVKSALQFIINNSADYQVSQKIVLLGASAGAHLALLQGYKYSSPVKPKAIVSFFAPTDLIDMYNRPANSLVQAGLVSVIGKTPIQDSLLYAKSSPVNFVNSTSPATILLHGGLDPLVRVSQSTTLKTKLDANNVINQLVIYPNEGHGWFGSVLFDSFNKIEVFLKANVN